MFKFCISWLGRRDSNPRMPAPEAGALPLGDSPMPGHRCMITIVDQGAA